MSVVISGIESNILSVPPWVHREQLTDSLEQTHEEKVGKESSFHYTTTLPDFEPEGGWQIISPKHIIPSDTEDTGLYLIELNQKHRDFFVFNTKEKLQRLKEELLFLAYQKGTKHVVLSFYDCRGIDNLGIQQSYGYSPPGRKSGWRFSFYKHNVEGAKWLAKLLIQTREDLNRVGRKFSIIRNDPTLEKNGLYNTPEVIGFVHENLEDAVKNTPDVPAYKVEPAALYYF